ncbi:MAG: NUDIX domain-containing protein [Candidatus Nanopelagicales bacterium]
MSSEPAYRDTTGRSLADYPHPSVAVDTAVLTVPPGADGLNVLLVRRAGTHEHGAWALPGTFLHPGETLAQAVLRSLADKAGIRGLAPRQLHVFDDPDRDDRGWVLSVAHLDAVTWLRLAATVASRDDGAVVPVAQAVGLPYDHDQIVALAVHTLRARYREEPDPDRLLPAPFTLLELRHLHQAVLGTPLLKDTFRRQMAPQLTATDETREGVVGKPAALFRHKPRRGRGATGYSVLPGT